MSHITRERFIEIMRDFASTRDADNRIKSIIEQEPMMRDAVDFFSSTCLHITAEPLAVELLASMFDDESSLIEYWMYEQDFGRCWQPGDMIDENGNYIVLSDAGALYDYLCQESD